MINETEKKEILKAYSLFEADKLEEAKKLFEKNRKQEDALIGIFLCKYELYETVDDAESILNETGFYVYLLRIYLNCSCNNLEKAEAEMINVAERDKSKESYLRCYFHFLIKKGNESEIKDFIKNNKNDKQVVKRGIEYYFSTNQIDLALKLCKKAIQKFPNDDICVYAKEKCSKIQSTNDTAEVAKIGNSSDKSDSIDELNSLIGLNDVKKEIQGLKAKLEFENIRNQSLGYTDKKNESYNFIFTGNPGTGKTTIARLITKILFNIGCIEKNLLVETDRSGLVGAFQGHTALKTHEMVKKAIGGVLFIDEAYALIHNEHDDFGREAIDTLVKEIEDHRGEVSIILAGYKDEMQELLNSNPGLESRFTNVIEFPDYTTNELLQIAKQMAEKEHYKFDVSGEREFKRIISKKKLTVKFGNARAVRNLMDDIFTIKALNYYKNEDSLEYLTTITQNDFLSDKDKAGMELSLEECKKNIDKLIGIKKAKNELEEMAAIASYTKKELEEQGKYKEGIPINMHMCFTGNPGTGKTTVARLFGSYLAGLDILPEGQLIEASRNDLVGRYQGETAIKTKKICEKAYGGILFIDEAYSIVNSDNDSFGLEAVSILIKEMEDNRNKFIVILAGYSKEIKNFLNTNSGLASRISKTIEFEDYNEQELVEIFKLSMDVDKISFDSVETEKYLEKVIYDIYKTKTSKFGNAREMRNLYENIWKKMVFRVEKNKLEGVDRKKITIEDIKNASGVY